MNNVLFLQENIDFKKNKIKYLIKDLLQSGISLSQDQLQKLICEKLEIDFHDTNLIDTVFSEMEQTYELQVIYSLPIVNLSSGLQKASNDFPIQKVYVLNNKLTKNISLKEFVLDYVCKIGQILQLDIIELEIERKFGTNSDIQKKTSIALEELFHEGFVDMYNEFYNSKSFGPKGISLESQFINS